MKKILIGVSGGIAAYKAASVVSALKQAGHDVQVAMTPAACKFVAPLTFAALSQKEVRTELFTENPADKGRLFPHLYPSTTADLFALMPATANTIAKIAHGCGDNIVTAAALSLSKACVKMFCPAMNAHMWENPAVQKNVTTLEAFGWQRIGPGAGRAACGSSGAGRMSEPEEILAAIHRALA